MKRRDWLINLQNAATAVARHYGQAEVLLILSKYNATSLNNLQACYYDIVFGELDGRAKQADED